MKATRTQMSTCGFQPLVIATYTQAQTVVSLFRQGHGFSSITSQTGLGRKLISRILAREGINTHGRTFTVMEDPSGIFFPGSAFDQAAITAGLWMNTWPDGVQFLERRSGHVYRVESWMCESRGREIERQLLVNEVMRATPTNVHSLRFETLG